MVRPARFGFNQETAASNPFQQVDSRLSPDEASRLALKEFDHVVEILMACGIEVYVVQDTPNPSKSDAVFPNNWISFHESGLMVTYPMMSKSRRREIREEILDDMTDYFEINETWRMHQQVQNGFLEGTGSLVLDRQHRKAYACRSSRTDETLLYEFCERLRFQPVFFDAVDSKGIPFYHTNVMMAVTGKNLVVCLESIKDVSKKRLIEQTAKEANKMVVEISLEQVRNFAGNMLQIGAPNERPLLAMSTTARKSLSDQQLTILENESDVLAFSIPTIERYGGGSIRCMLAEIFVEPRKNSTL